MEGKLIPKITQKSKNTEKKKAIKSALLKTWPERLIHKPKLDINITKIPNIPSPSRDLLFCVLFGFFGFLIAGGLYILVVNPPVLIYENQNGFIIPVFFWRDLHEQFILEGIAFSLIIMIGFIGTYFIYHSSKHFYNVNYAQKLLVIGIVMLLISFIVADLMIASKLPDGTYFYNPQVF